MSIIILEGMDTCFKTTIAEKLSGKLGLPVIKGSSFELAKCTNEELFNHFMKQTELDNVIIDRSIWSNLTYAPHYKDYAMLTKEQKEQFEDAIRHKATVYFLFADDHVIEERIKTRGDDYVDVSMVETINNTYHEVMMDAAVKIVAYDTEVWTSDEIASEIAKDYKSK